MTTQPLPPIQQDPAFIAAQGVHATHAERVAAINSDHRLSDAGRAERIAEVTDQSNAELQKLADNLTARREARLAELKAMLPVGPDIPDGTSPADQTVMHAAFRQALNDARVTAPADLPGKLADAERYGDTTAVRGIMTAALDDPKHRTTVAAYAANHPEVADALNELPTINGHGDITRRAFEMQVFHRVDVNPLAISSNF